MGRADRSPSLAGVRPGRALGAGHRAWEANPHVSLCPTPWRPAPHSKNGACPQGFLMIRWPGLGGGDEPGSSRGYREGQDQMGRGKLWVDFCLASKGDTAVDDRGQKGRHRNGQRFASQPSQKPCGCWIVPPPFYRGEDCAPERGLLAKLQPTNERHDQDLIPVSLLQSPCLFLIPSHLPEDRTDPS